MNDDLFNKMKNDAENYIPKPIWAEDDGETILGYMCLTDFECELGGASDGNHVYPSLSSLLSLRKCVIGCGIVQVEVKVKKVILEPRRHCDKDLEKEREDYVMELERQQYYEQRKVLDA